MISFNLKRIFEPVNSLILPAFVKCKICCRRKALDEISICTVCNREIELMTAGYFDCEICGRFLQDERDEKLCPQCRESKPPFTAARALGPYCGILKYAIHNLKFCGDRKLAVPLGKMLGKKISRLGQNIEVDIVVPVPMFFYREKRRGFNQSALLADEVSSELSKPLSEGLLQKQWDTIPQTELTFNKRSINLKDSFCVSAEFNIRGKSVLLVDDIITTGSTAAECSKELLNAGAKQVIVGVVAAGVNNKHFAS